MENTAEKIDSRIVEIINEVKRLQLISLLKQAKLEQQGKAKAQVGENEEEREIGRYKQECIKLIRS